MPGPAETIRAYLVSLGFEVDKGSYDQANRAVNTLEKGFKEFASGAVLNLGKASLAIAGFYTAAQAGVAKFLTGLGNQEIQMEMLSRQLWTTQQQAQAFNATLQAMGTNLQDLYLSPTLMKQYEHLHGVAEQMTLPGDYNQTISQVQDLQLQFKQLRLEAYYGLQWVGYYLTKYLSGPLSKAQSWLQSLNKLIVKNMPTWTQRVAEVMASFEQAGVNIVHALGDVWNWLKKMADYLPTWAKVVGGALALISISNPFMLFVEAISGALLMLDDFMTYLKDPSKSAFPKLWSWVMKLYDTLQNNGTIASFQGDIENLLHSVGDLGSSIYNLITAIGDLYGKLNGSQNQSGLVNFFQMLANMADFTITTLTRAIETLGDFVSMVADVLHGKWKDAAEMFVKYHQLLGAGPPVSNSSPNNSNGKNGTNPANAWGTTTPGGYGPKSYPYMFQHVTNNSSSHSSASNSKTMNASVTVTQHIHGQSGPRHSATMWETAAETRARFLIGSFRGVW